MFYIMNINMLFTQRFIIIIFFNVLFFFFIIISKNEYFFVFIIFIVFFSFLNITIFEKVCDYFLFLLILKHYFLSRKLNCSLFSSINILLRSVDFLLRNILYELGDFISVFFNGNFWFGTDIGFVFNRLSFDLNSLEIQFVIKINVFNVD